MGNRELLEHVGEGCTYEKECNDCDMKDECTKDLVERGIKKKTVN